MSTLPDQIPREKPFYKQFRFYGKFILVIFLGLFLLLVSTIIALRWINPPATSFTMQANWEELGAEPYSLRNHWVSSDDIPLHMKWAVIASEDQLFLEHWGFDFESMQEAWEERKQGNRVRGASTISQQVSKNLFLTPAETLFRKGIEAGITVLIEVLWPKERVLEVYLNIAEFGPGTFGIGKASKIYFDRHASDLEPKMATKLAAVLPSPKRMRVNPPSPYAKQRSYWILKQMTQLSGIAYHQPLENVEAPESFSIQMETPDTLRSITTTPPSNNHTNRIRSVNIDQFIDMDSVRVDLAVDSLRFEE